MYRVIFKRFIDLFIATIAFFLLSPLILIITILLFVSNKGKPFFLQKRPGKAGRIFTIIKFKTMNDRTDGTGRLLEDDQRLSGIGKIVRRLSLDELPQLLNVIRGDMSLIGPRPLLVEYLELYNVEQKKRHNVRPGITGWAQVNGRNTIDWNQKFKYDIWYVDNVSLKLDFIILCKTIYKVFKAKDITPKTSSTMEKFTGSLENRKTNKY